ncbi:hypothetical protein KAR91_20370 [Candidatus Pacearchaeota archaeon]|nr:hypothetical protein [Candidatus Pacearchaeota archaeon]
MSESKCERHPRYQGKGQPKSACCQCWDMWTYHWPTKPSGPFVNVLKKFKAAVIREFMSR